MFDSYFSPVEQGVIAGAVALTGLACWAHVRERDGAAIGLLLIVAFALRLMSSQLDPYLNLWDESVHAVVAKNMVEHPFTPMLYTDTAMGLSYEYWTHTHIWLHKQPFFLWMMALSIGTFGNTLFALRLPSVLFTTALVYFTYGIARAVHGRSVAIAAALFMSWSFWFLMLVLGAVITDHNDAMFISLVGGAFWAWFRWRDHMSMGKAICIGLFMGCAVLTKWLPGFLLMGGWAVVAVAERSRMRTELRWMTTAFLIALVVALPWQISAWLRFPGEMAHEMAFNSLHLWEPVEGHTGDGWFYFRTLSEQFTPFGPWVVLVGTLLSIVFTKRRDHRLMVLVSVALTYGIYSFAATKMSTYTMVVIPFLFIGIAWLVQQVVRPIANTIWQTGVFLLLSLVGAGSLFRLELIQMTHTEQAMRDPYYGQYRGANIHNLDEIEKLVAFVGPKDNAIIYHVPFPANLNMMYFHGHQVTPDLPSPERTGALIDLGRKVVVVDPTPEMVANLPDGVRYYYTKGEGFRIPPL